MVVSNQSFWHIVLITLLLAWERQGSAAGAGAAGQNGTSNYECFDQLHALATRWLQCSERDEQLFAYRSLMNVVQSVNKLASLG